MINLQSKIIANEFTISPNMINYKVESHMGKKSRLAEESNGYLSEISVLNKAELTAMKQEQLRFEEEINKKKLIEERNRKLKESVKNYKSTQKLIDEEIKKKNENEKKIKMYKIKEYNNQLKDKALKKNQKSSTDKNCAQNEYNAEYDTFSFNHGNMKEHEETLRDTNSSQHKYINDEVEEEPQPIESHMHGSVINIREDIDKIIKEKIHLAVANSNLIPEGEDLNHVNFHIHVNNVNFNPENINQELDRNVENVREFRKTGLLMFNSNTTNSKSINLQPQTNQGIAKQNLESNEDQIRRKNELEKRRYMKALRNLMIEKFKEKSIVIPNICSCGQLQRKLDTLLEDKNVSVYSIINIECANNCIYYNNTHDYHKALSDIIQSVKNLKFDCFKDK